VLLHLGTCATQGVDDATFWASSIASVRPAARRGPAEQ
jgi:hypothetical protein